MSGQKSDFSCGNPYIHQTRFITHVQFSQTSFVLQFHQPTESKNRCLSYLGNVPCLGEYGNSLITNLSPRSQTELFHTDSSHPILVCRHLNICIKMLFFRLLHHSTSCYPSILNNLAEGMKHHRRTFRVIHVCACGNRQHLCIDGRVENSSISQCVSNVVLFSLDVKARSGSAITQQTLVTSALVASASLPCLPCFCTVCCALCCGDEPPTSIPFGHWCIVGVNRTRVPQPR